MGKVIVATKFNKTGSRSLNTPLDGDKVEAPARRRYQEAHRAAQAAWKLKWDCARRRYIDRMAQWIASYVARDSTPAEEKYRIAKFLAERTLMPVNPGSLGSSSRWSNQLGGIPELTAVEQEIWEAYVETFRKADAEKETDLHEASLECADMKRALWREITGSRVVP